MTLIPTSAEVTLGRLPLQPGLQLPRAAQQLLAQCGLGVEAAPLSWDVHVAASRAGRAGVLAAQVLLAQRGGSSAGAAMAVAVVRSLPGGLCWVQVPGGVLAGGDADAELVEALGAALREYAAEHHAVFLRYEPQTHVPASAVLGAARPTDAANAPQHTLWIDIAKEDEALLASFKEKGRYHVRKGLAAGLQAAVAVQPADALLREWYVLLRTTAARDGFAAHGYAAYAALAAAPHASLVTVRDEAGVLHAGLLLVRTGAVCTYLYGASSGHPYAAFVAQWQAMRHARDAGATVYDMLGIAPEGDASHELAGVTQFKTRFGGRRVAWAAPALFIYRPVAYLCYAAAIAARDALRRVRGGH